MNLLIATSNLHKFQEISHVLSGSGALTLSSLADLRVDIPEPEEDAPTFEGNARIKAEAYAAEAGLPTLADDSGLVVDALSGKPGVHSARYAWDDFEERWSAMPRRDRDLANNAKLLAALEGVPAGQRSARFVCAMVLVFPDGGREEVVAEGVYPGRILMPHEAEDPEEPQRGRGNNGFGYDPLLVLDDTFPQHAGKTSAERAPAEKNAISHRGVATRRVREYLVAARVLQDSGDRT